MDLHAICLNCFQYKGDFDVCPYCGFVEGTAPREAYHLRPGTVLAQRHIVGTVLGFGGFGVTYKAWDTKLSVVVAIKEFYPGGLVNRIPGETEIMVFSGERQQSFLAQKERFLDEARNMAKFNGDLHVVNVYDFFEANNTAYIVMEYLDGQTLKEYMAEKGGRLDVEESLRTTGFILDGIASIHKKGIIHRDISPDNVYMLRDGRVKLLDFGAARFSPDEGIEQTRSVVIKLGYAPPEQYRSKMKQGPWTDIYAAGATLYKMITGVTPEESVDRIEKDGLERPSKLGIAIDVDTEKAIMTAMALRPELRFQKAEHMKSALEHKARVDFPEEALKKRKARRVAGVVAAAVVLMGLGAYVGYQGTQASDAPTLANAQIEPGSVSLLIRAEQGSQEAQTFSSLLSRFSEQYPDYRVELSAVPSATYEEELGRMQRAGNAPTVYLVPHGMADAEKYLADLGLLLDSLKRSDYLFLKDYETYYPSGRAMPLGFHAVVGYENTVLAEERGLARPKQITSMQNVASLASTPGQHDVAIVRNRTGYFLSLFAPQAYRDGKIDRAALEPGVTALAEAYATQQMLGADPLDLLWSDDLAYLIADTSYLREVQEALPGYYSVLPVKNGNKMQGSFTCEYGVSAAATENEQKIGMLLINFMLSEYAQNLLFVQGDEALPINRPAFQTYVSINAEMDFLSQSVDNINLFGEDDAPVRFFGNALYDEIIAPGMQTGEIAAHMAGMPE